jgi:DNA-binding CsgD family transcriptional regulator
VTRGGRRDVGVLVLSATLFGVDVVPCPIVVAREAELEALGRAVTEAGAGRGGVVALAGPAGIGKSRLLREVAGQVSRLGWLVLTGRAVSTGATVALRPFAEAVQQAFRDVELPTDDEIGLWPGALAEVLPGLGRRTPATRDEASPTMRAETILRLLRSRAATGVLLGLEDLHWADPDSLTTFEYLADNLYAERILCVTTVRSEPVSRASALVDELSSRRSILKLQLAGLPDDAVARLVAACRRDATPAEIRDIVAAADGLPFLAEELLAAPGVPTSFAASVTDRLENLPAEQRRVIQSAAVLGRQFDWRLLPTAAATDSTVVHAALEAAVGCLLLDAEGDSFRFRHALTRDAIVDGLLPTVRAELAAAALAAIEARGESATGVPAEVAADLAEQAGLAGRASELLLAAGEAALRRGTVATAADTLQRAAALGADDTVRRTATGLAVAALALAGRLDEALSLSAPLLHDETTTTVALRTETHLAVAHAAVEATRWELAQRHLSHAEQLLPSDVDSPLRQRWRVMAAECALAGRDIAEAQRLVDLVLTSATAPAEVRCHAFALLGRSRRSSDLDAARDAFEQARAEAESAQLPLWRMRALHELGTIDLFDHAGTQRLDEARAIAEQLGALSTAAMLDLQLTAAHLFRFAAEPALAHASSALAAADRLQLVQLRVLALVVLAEVHAIRLDAESMERHEALALAAASGDPEIEGSVWGSRATAALLADDDAAALRCLQRAEDLLAPLPGAGPALYRGYRPLLLAVIGDPRATAAIAAARRTGITVNRANRGLLALADAVLAGRRAQADAAAELADLAAADLAAYPGWADLALLLTARAALADGWGQPRSWLERSRAFFDGHGLDALTRRCAALLAEPTASLVALGITRRELDVLKLVVAGRSNKEIAAQLFLSPRTVEKHVESLLRKTGVPSRTSLAVTLAEAL